MEPTDTEVSPKFLWEFMWMFALWALNRAFQSTAVEQQKMGLLLDSKEQYKTVTPSPSIRSPSEEHSPAIARVKLEQGQQKISEEVASNTDLVAAEEEAHSSDDSTSAVDEGLYRTMLTKHARVLPALANKSLNAAPVKNFRATVLKREAARCIILEGIDKLSPEVSCDCDSDPRASMAIADFHAVQQQFSKEGMTQEVVTPGSPSWKRMCRVVSFLKRNVEPQTVA